MRLSASHSINLGIARVTFSKSGVTVSSGIPGLRVFTNTKGEVGVRAGVKGLSYTKKKKLIKVKK